jgi:outer membrane protein assembly factor BamC
MSLVKHLPRPSLTLLGTAVLLAASGCSVLEPDKIDYKSSGGRAVSLEVPPDLTQLPGQSRYTVQDGPVSASSYQKAGQVAAATSASTQVAASAIADVQFMHKDGVRWLRVARPADQVWGPVREFWLDSGFLLTEDQPAQGIMQTDWAENRAKIPEDIIRRTLGKALDSLYSTGERDRFRIRLERNDAGGTDIFVTPSGMQEVSNVLRDNTVWQPRPRDPELENEFLRRLMVKLGVAQEQAKAIVAAAAQNQANAAAAPAAARVDSSGAQATIQLNDDFDRAWRRVGLALDRTGFTVEDRDRTKGIYFVRYVDPATEKKEPGFFGRLLGAANSEQLPTAKYQIVVRTEGAASTVTVRSDSGAPAPVADAQRIVKILTDELR